MGIEKHPIFEALRRSPDVCACSALRKATRVTAQLYDRCLAPSGLTTAQFSTMAALYYERNIPMKKLAARLVMERSTLTRTLAPLERRGFVEIVPDKEDARLRIVRITASGLEILICALPYWQEIQNKIEEKMGDSGWKELQESLRKIIDAARSSGKNNLVETE